MEAAMDYSIQQPGDGWTDADNTDQRLPVADPRAAVTSSPLNGDHPSAVGDKGSIQQQRKKAASRRASLEATGDRSSAVGDEANSAQLQHRGIEHAASPDLPVDLTVRTKGRALSSVEKQPSVTAERKVLGKTGAGEDDTGSPTCHSNILSGSAFGSGSAENGGSEGETPGRKTQQHTATATADDVGSSSSSHPDCETDGVPVVPSVDSEVEVSETVEVEAPVSGILDVDVEVSGDVEVSEDVEVEMEVPAADCSELDEVSAAEVVMESSVGVYNGDGSGVDSVENVDVNDVAGTVDFTEDVEVADGHVANAVDIVDTVGNTVDVESAEVADDNVESTVDVDDSIEVAASVVETVEITDDNQENTIDVHTTSDTDRSTESTTNINTVSVPAVETADASVKEEEKEKVSCADVVGLKASESQPFPHSMGQANAMMLAENRQSETVTQAEVDYRPAKKQPNLTVGEAEPRSDKSDLSHNRTGDVYSPERAQVAAAGTDITGQVGTSIGRNAASMDVVEDAESASVPLETTCTGTTVKSDVAEDFESVGRRNKVTGRHLHKEGSCVGLERDVCGGSACVHVSKLESESVTDECVSDDDRDTGSDMDDQGVPLNSVHEDMHNKGKDEDEATNGMVCDETVDKHKNKKQSEGCEVAASSLPAAEFNKKSGVTTLREQSPTEDKGTSYVEQENQSCLRSKCSSPATAQDRDGTDIVPTSLHKSGSREFRNIFNEFTNAEDAGCHSPATPDGKESDKQQDERRDRDERGHGKNSTASESNKSESLRQNKQLKRKGEGVREESDDSGSDGREPRPKRKRLSDGKGSKMTDSDSHSEAKETIQRSKVKQVGREISPHSITSDNEESDGEDSSKDSETAQEGEAKKVGQELSMLSDSDDADESADEGNENESKLKQDDRDSQKPLSDEKEEKSSSSEDSAGDEDNDEDKKKESESSLNETGSIAKKAGNSAESSGGEGDGSVGGRCTMDLDQGTQASCSKDSSDLSNDESESSSKIKGVNSGESTAVADKVSSAEDLSVLQNMNEVTQASFSDSDSDEEVSDKDSATNKVASSDSRQLTDKISPSDSRNTKEGFRADSSDESNDEDDKDETEIQPANVKNTASAGVSLKTSDDNRDSQVGAVQGEMLHEEVQSNSSSDCSSLDSKGNPKEDKSQKVCTVNEERKDNFGEADKTGDTSKDGASNNAEVRERPSTPELQFSRVKTPRTYSRQAAPSQQARAAKTATPSAKSVSGNTEGHPATEQQDRPSTGKSPHENGEAVRSSESSSLRQVHETHLVQDPGRSKPSIVSRITKALNSSAQSHTKNPVPNANVSMPSAHQPGTKVRVVTRTRAAKVTDKVVPATEGTVTPKQGAQQTQIHAKVTGKVKRVSDSVLPLSKTSLPQQAQRKSETGSGRKQSQPKKAEDGGGGGGVQGSSGGGEHKCGLCGRTFSALDRFRKHEQGHASGKNFCCMTCGKLFDSEEKLVTHKLVHQRSSTGTFTCNICGEVCKNWRPFLYHLSKHNANQRKKFTCDICGHTLSSADRLSRHSWNHKRGCNFCCFTCGKLFTTQERLDTHTLAHPGQSASVLAAAGLKRQLSTSSSEAQPAVNETTANASPAITEAAVPVPTPRGTRKQLEEEAGERRLSSIRTKEISHSKRTPNRESVSDSSEGVNGGATELMPDSCQLRKSSRKRKHSRQRCTCCPGSPVAVHAPSHSLPEPSPKRMALGKEEQGWESPNRDGLKGEWDRTSLKECSVKLERSSQLSAEHSVPQEASSPLKAVKTEISSPVSKSVKAEPLSPLPRKSVKLEVLSPAGKSAKSEAVSTAPRPSPISLGSPANIVPNSISSTPSPIAPAPEDQCLPATMSTTTTTTTTTTALSGPGTPKRPPKKAKRPASEPYEGRKVKIYRTASAKMLPKNLALSSASRERARKGPREKAASKPEPAVVSPPAQDNTPKRSFPCRICGETFPSDSAVKIHIGKHLTNVPPKKVAVDIESVAQSCHLSYSQGSASPEGGYSCHRCGYAARTYADLSKHMWMHSRKGFQCTECCASFSLAETLQHHMKAHKGRTPPQQAGKRKASSGHRCR